MQLPSSIRSGVVGLIQSLFGIRMRSPGVWFQSQFPVSFGDVDGRYFGVGVFGGAPGNAKIGVQLPADGSVMWCPSSNALVQNDTGIARSAVRVIGLIGAANNAGTAATLSSTPVTPAQITANTNNYAPTAGAMYYRLSSDAARSITGLVAGVDGQITHFINVGSFNITLDHESASSTAANRFLTTTGAGVVVAANARVQLLYDATSARWRVYT